MVYSTHTARLRRLAAPICVSIGIGRWAITGQALATPVARSPTSGVVMLYGAAANLPSVLASHSRPTSA